MHCKAVVQALRRFEVVLEFSTTKAPADTLCECNIGNGVVCCPVGRHYSRQQILTVNL